MAATIKSSTAKKPRTSKKINATPKTTEPAPNFKLLLKLYVAGQTPKSIRAMDNLKRICEEHIKEGYSIEVIDLVKNPQLAKGDEIFAVPTLVRQLPHPIRKIIGDLSNTERTLVGLQIKPAI